MQIAIITAMAAISMVAGMGVAHADQIPPQQYACDRIAGGGADFPNLLYDLKRLYGITTDQAWDYIKAATSPVPNYLGVSDLCYQLYPDDMARKGY
jgi:hypothetical protein